MWAFVDDMSNPIWQEADADSRESAIACGRREFGEDAAFWISRAEYPDPADAFMGATELLERAGEYAADNWHDDLAEDWPPTPGQEARDELDALLAKWARTHCPVTFWMTVGEPELIPAPARVPVCVGSTLKATLDGAR
jgi:hypothetical protein